jgi:hypothetical protein
MRGRKGCSASRIAATKARLSACTHVANRSHLLCLCHTQRFGLGSRCVSCRGGGRRDAESWHGSLRRDDVDTPSCAPWSRTAFPTSDDRGVDRPGATTVVELRAATRAISRCVEEVSKAGELGERPLRRRIAGVINFRLISAGWQPQAPSRHGISAWNTSAFGIADIAPERRILQFGRTDWEAYGKRELL